MPLPPPPDIVLRTKWYITIRWFILAAITCPSLISLFVTEGLSDVTVRSSIIALAAVTSNAAFYLISRFCKGLRAYSRLAVSLLATDIALITAFIFVNGGIESRSIILYVLPIILTAAVFGGTAVYVTTITCIILYDSIIIGDYLGIFTTVGSYNPELRLIDSYVMNTLFFMTATLAIFGICVEFITRVLKQQEQYARESLQALRLAQSIAKLGTWEWSVKDKRLTWSDELYTVFGVDKDFYRPDFESYMEMIYPDDRKKVLSEVRKALKRPYSYSVDHRVVHPNGVIHYVHGEGQSFADRHGVITHMVGTGRDITDEKQLEEAKTDFVSLASHQLRTPATGVKQYLGMLIDGFAGKLNRQQTELLQTAYESNERQLAIVDDLLYVAQVDSGNMRIQTRSIDVRHLVEHIIAEITPRIRSKQQTIQFRCRNKQVIANLDRPRLRMALENIIENAHKYTAKGKKIIIKLARSKSEVIISISDQGVGIAQKDINRLFKKFSRIDNPVSTLVGGSGLGLYWACRVIALHGGRIEVESQVGKGTTFHIYLPSGGKVSTTAKIPARTSV